MILFAVVQHAVALAFADLSLPFPNGDSLNAAIYKKLIKDKSLIFQFDHGSSLVDTFVGGSQDKSLLHQGIHNTNFSKQISRSLQPLVFSAKFTPSLWTFVSFIEDYRTVAQAEDHLRQLLKVGHPRRDRFLLVGFHKSLKDSYQKASASIIDKFKNIITLSLDTGKLQKRISSRFVHVSSETVSWITVKSRAFTGQHIHICGTIFPPYLDAIVDAKSGKWKVVGVNYKMFQTSSQKYNFTFDYYSIEEWKTPGQYFPNGTWGGGIYFIFVPNTHLYFLGTKRLQNFNIKAIGEVISSRADVAAISFHIYDWNKLASFVGPMGVLEMEFTTSVPAKTLGKTGFLYPYHSDVWGYVIVAFLLMTTLMFLAMYISRRKCEETDISAIKVLANAVVNIWGLNFDQNAGQVKQMRHVTILWIGFTVVMNTGYKSNLAALMSRLNPEMKPKTFSELAVSEEYTIYFDKSAGAAWYYIETSNNRLLKKLGRRMVPVDPTKCVMLSFIDNKAVCTTRSVKIKPTEKKNLSMTHVPTLLTTSTD